MEQERWDRARLETYIDTTESLKVEFKSFKALVPTDKKNKAERIAEAARDVAGMANEQGGVILYGIDEVGSGPWRRARAIEDGFASEHDVSRDRFLQLMRDHIQPPLTELEAYDVRLNPENESQPRCALVIIVPQARGYARQTDDYLHWRRDAQGLSRMSAQQIADVAARVLRPSLELLVSVRDVTPNIQERFVDLRTQFRIFNPSSATASFAVITVGVGWRSTLVPTIETEWHWIEEKDEIKVVRLVISSGGISHWSPMTPGFTFFADDLTIRTPMLHEVDSQGPRDVGLVRIDHDGGSTVYGLAYNPNSKHERRLFLRTYDPKWAKAGYLEKVGSLPLFQLNVTGPEI